jgi:hypothetical protein
VGDAEGYVGSFDPELGTAKPSANSNHLDSQSEFNQVAQNTLLSLTSKINNLIFNLYLYVLVWFFYLWDFFQKFFFDFLPGKVLLFSRTKNIYKFEILFHMLTFVLKISPLCGDKFSLEKNFFEFQMCDNFKQQFSMMTSVYIHFLQCENFKKFICPRNKFRTIFAKRTSKCIHFFEYQNIVAM